MSKTVLSELPSDLISELLTGMRLRGVKYRRIDAGSRFGFNFPARPGFACFHFIASGSALLRKADGSVQVLPAGYAVFMPRAAHHQLLSDSDALVQDIDTPKTIPLGESVCAINTCCKVTNPEKTVIFHGCMEFDPGGMQGLIRLMPDELLADTLSDRYPGLLPILSSMKREICSGRIGYPGIMARLAEVVAAMLIRGWVECGCGNGSGLVAALKDPRLAHALLALHRHPGKEWTVAELAAECNSSRSVFAGRFRQTIGISPLRYATELRMQLASQWLNSERLPIETVAQRLGYTSQAAFSRAFKRITGHPPGASRQARNNQ
ncbi:AraC family transcriptional regulator [Tatumella citrea]|uniref:AraC family transcriptional regulator n=1 Tax=Tatumella citrea TaxID=53336 RepID=A0A1Y0LCU9_TATCI|nr:AraC family transcriptional regulator [Tatumella citrea]ARU95896.1 AraC family transcriptional regulator [Tatumella citrea]ARU99936.1 AraC family transcriptional regulator [Tatumella citrea]